MNPLLAPWTAPYDLPPFDKIEDSHFAEGFDTALTEARADIAAIADNPAAPSFANTIDAFEMAGQTLDRVASVFFNEAATNTNAAIKALQRDLSPKLAAFSSDIMMNAALFARIEALYDSRETLDLSAEQDRVLFVTRRRFVLSGAKLEGADRDRLRAVMQELAELGTGFAQSVQQDEEDWFMHLSADDMEGLPDHVLSAARGAAEERGLEGHVVTLSRSLIVPFLQMSKRRELREAAFRAWTGRGDMNDATRTLGQITRMLELRKERAALLGYPDYAHFKLETEMAKTPDRVRSLLLDVWEPAKARAMSDAAALEELMREDGLNDDLAPWDWRHYAAIRQKRDHDIDEEQIKPYLELDAMIDAAFACATRLFGLSFAPLDVPLHHPDARAWNVRMGDRHMGVFVGDYFNRSGKRSGAWCSGFRTQSGLGDGARPHVINVCNFAKPGKGEPALLTFDDARTLFHEFGHALHSLLSDVTYPSIAGTAVARDFVELPSQLYEHWLSTPEVLSEFARHVDTGAPMPGDLLERLLAAENFDQGFATVEYVASALVDLDFHTGQPPADVMTEQARILSDLGMPAAITMRHATPHFQHVFAGEGYAAGYYSYMWSEVMDADAFAAFEEAGDPFDPDTAQALATHIYSAGGSKDAEALYLAFRGRMPGVEALLKQRGLAA